MTQLARQNLTVAKTVGMAIMVGMSLWLGGCSDQTASSSDDRAAAEPMQNDQRNLSVFEGCYTVSRSEPAQIRVSEQAGSWVMQMKEPSGSGRVWDTPEALEVLDKREMGNYFSIDADNVDAVIARPDRVLVMAHVKPAYANIDPLLDSEYLSFIYKGANTIYRVECDEVATDILANPHANIDIQNIDDSTESL